ncbi:hypothetical protein Lepto7375DRAFT_0099 [Leptolyngbya sp. PCC 7375]|nr:hypothetical protein Lepto7375DRAFT_0099 [Leptolyngbya sp. PCC 7375]
MCKKPQLLAEADTDILEGIDSKLRDEEKLIQQKLDATEKLWIEVTSSNVIEIEEVDKQRIETDYKKLLIEYQDIQTRIRAASPHYAALNYPQPLKMRQVQQQILDEDTVLLQYSLAEKHSYLWVVTTEGMTSYQLPPRRKLEILAQDLRDSILHDTTELGFIAKSASQLSQEVLPAAISDLQKKRILVAADGVLQYVPFSLLTLSEDQSPLITQYEVINLPSSSSLATIRNKTRAREVAPKTLAILADPVFSPDDERIHNSNTSLSQQQTLNLELLTLRRSVRSLATGELTRLHGTRHEAKAILSFVQEETQKTYALDFDANLATVTNPQLNQYRIVHFATHGILNTELPELSGVVLSMVDKNGSPINGFLSLNKIFNLNLSADLVVTSACQTGLGKEVRGEGLIGLTRGFMYAGSPRLLVSLWKVDDYVTAEMMTRFYRLMLDEKLPPVAALKEMQLEMIRETEWKSPYYWAAFALQGEWQ